MRWNGAGGWVIFSHDRQVNFSRTVLGERVHRRAADRRRRDLGRARCRFLELQLQLVEQLAATLGGLPVLFASQLGDLQLVIGDQRLSARGARLGLLPRFPLGGKSRRQRRDRLGCGHEPECRTPGKQPGADIPD
jgi:hypothetical protein